MALEKYQEKRNFDETPEPAGQARKGRGPLRFVIQKHQASRLHYDFRLEIGGVLKSWAVPKGPSLNPEDKRLAMMTEDHPYEYKDFEGIIPAGNYGAGAVMIWDEGTYFPGYVDHGGKVQKTGRSRSDQDKELRHQLHKGHLTFIMEGQKLNGEFALIKIKNSDNEDAWLLIKKGDDFADAKRDITKTDRSAVTGRTMKQIASAADRQWTRQGEALDLDGAPLAPMPHDVKPMLATLTDVAFDRDGWVFEIKWDGYRAIAEVEKNQVRLYSRNLQPFNAKFAPIVESLQDLAHNAVLDGEVVVIDQAGRSRFQLLQNYQKTGQGNLVYYVFDLLWLDGRDLTSLPLTRRKQILAEILPTKPNIRLSDHIETRGAPFFEASKKQALEGILAKNGASAYRPGVRSHSWLKIKTHLRQEAVIGGYTAPKGSRTALGALLLGVYDHGKLQYIGHAGSGLDDQALEDMKRLLDPLVRATSPFSASFKTNALPTWVEPKIVAEVSFGEWTEDGLMRQPILLGWRQDKPPQSVKRELPDSSALSSAVKADRPVDVIKSAGDQELSINRHKLKITHLNKIFWPQDGYTKGDVLSYYHSIAPTILPYLKDRPQSLNRHPNGITGSSFYHKDMDTDKIPRWIKTFRVHSESENRDIDYLVCNDLAALLYMANLACIEVNPWSSRINKPDHPDYLVIDLDPEGIGFDAVIKTAQVVGEVLNQAQVPSYPKTSGATGLHIYVPLAAKYNYDQAKEFARLISLMVNQRLPDITSLERSPAKRQGKVYLDYLQNRRGQTLAAAYSLRPRPGATISTPLRWDEVEPGLDPSLFTLKTFRRRLDAVGDLWKPVIGPGIDMTAVLKNFA